MKTEAVITIKVIDDFGQICTCNMIESLDQPFERLLTRLNNLDKTGIKRTGDTTIQFVITED